MAEPNKLSKREKRLQEMEKERRRKQLQVVIPIGFILFLLVGGTLYRIFEPDIEGIVQVESAIGNQHDPDVEIAFTDLPPMGGPHHPSWQNCGIYREPILARHAIHSMEHGVVWVTYNPEAVGSDQVSELEDMVRGRGHLLLSPYPDQAEPIALTTWDIQLTVESTDDNRIERFIERYRQARGPEVGASCSNGVGTPFSS